MKKTFLVASVACACALAVNADDGAQWFTGIGANPTISDLDPTAGTVWTLDQTHGDFEVNASNKLEFDLDDGYALAYDVSGKDAPDTNTITTVEVTGVFTPVKFSDLPDETAMTGRQAQVGFAICDNNGNTNYYGWVGGASWIRLRASAMPAPNPDLGETTLVVKFDYRHDGTTDNYVQFAIKRGTEYYLFDDNDVNRFAMTSPKGMECEQIGGMSCYGSGTLAQVDGKVQIGIAAVNGVKYPNLVSAAVNATDGNTITVLRETPENVTLPANTTLVDANGHATGTLTATGAVSIAVRDSDLVDGGVSGVHPLNLKTATSGSGYITAVLVENAKDHKEVVSTVQDGNTLMVTTRTKTSILEAVKPDTNNVDLALAPSGNIDDLRAFLASDEALNAADVSASVSADSLTNALNVVVSGGLPKWQYYALGLKTTESYKAVTIPAGDTNTTAITLAVPAATNAWVGGSSYTVTYKVNGTAVEGPQNIAITPPNGTSVTGATYTVTATLAPNNN